MELPAHPDTDDTGPGRRPATGTRWGAVLVIGVIAAFVVLVVTLHLAGVVGPLAH